MPLLLLWSQTVVIRVEKKQNNMEDSWEILINLRECKTFEEETCGEQMLPFLPRVGDVFWMSDACQEELTRKVRICRRQHGEKCKGTCPFANDKGRTDLNNEVIVHKVLFNVEHHEVMITLRDNSNIIWNQHE